tara:strand:+ start:217 stop:1362 length:1146 start_codon:yes stop_codon:yes gene_type:complete
MERTVANGAALTIAQEARLASRRGGTFDQSQEEPHASAQKVQCDDGAAARKEAEATAVKEAEAAARMAARMEAEQALRTVAKEAQAAARKEAQAAAVKVMEAQAAAVKEVEAAARKEAEAAARKEAEVAAVKMAEAEAVKEAEAAAQKVAEAEAAAVKEAEAAAVKEAEAAARKEVEAVAQKAEVASQEEAAAQVEVPEHAFPKASPSTASPSPMVADGVARCYLVFSPVSQGTLYAQWLYDAAHSDVREADVLACFVPAKPPPPFKMKHGGGRSELMREVGGPKKSRYYEGWTHFIKSAKGMGGEVTFLRNLDALSVAIYLLTDASEVRRLAIGDQVQLQGVLAAAVIPGASSGFEGCHTINSNVFHQTAAATGGAAVAL